MNVSNQIKKFRERDGYSQEFLAEKMFVSRQTISNWENDKSYPDIHNLLIMCQLFKVSLDELVEDDLKNVQIKNIKKELDFWTWMMIIPMVLGLRNPETNAPTTAPIVVAISRNIPIRILVKPSFTKATAAPEEVPITETSEAPIA